MRITSRFLLPRRRKKKSREYSSMATFTSQNDGVAADNAVALVGIACRFPGNVNDSESFWEMIASAVDGTSETPPDRFDTSFFYHPTPRTKGKMYNERGGYLSHETYPIRQFDRQFFRMPPAEASHLDPQIRMLLEVTWEALEDAGIPPSSVRGTNTGVYVGVTSNEYNFAVSLPSTNINAYTNSGTNSCMPSNRISYEFDFHGPSYTIDTACSSSLYAVHQACEAIRHGDCIMAIAGGANLLLLPTTSIGFCQAQMLSPDGRCKSFDASADGYSRSEGAGVVVLKPLAQALKDNDPIYAVIRGGALGNDGKTQGIAQPNYEAQVNLVGKACHNAGIQPEMVTYVEAHGTGTQAGDIAEAKALGFALGRKRPPTSPLYLGSVKSNIGHTEGAAGIAGVIKSALMLAKRKIPPVANFKSPNPNVNFDELNVTVPTSLLDWPQPRSEGRAIMGCSSFGFGGANAHIILEESPKPRYNEAGGGSETGDESTKSSFALTEPNLLLLSAATSTALDKHAKAWADFLERNPSKSALPDICYSAAVRSQHHRHRLAVIVNGIEDAKEHLNAFLSGKTSDNTLIGKTTEDSSALPIVFVFSGMGTQWWAMGRQLLEEDKIFLSTIEEIDGHLQSAGADWSLLSVLRSPREESRVEQTDIAQPCIFAVEVGILHVLREFDVIPEAVVGHSLGEVAAAYAAGLLTLKQATSVIYLRGRLLKETSGCGKMLVVLGNVAEVLDILPKSLFATTSLRFLKKTEQETEQAAYSSEKFDVAAINSSQQLVLSGDEEALTKAADVLKANEFGCKLLQVRNAFHSFQQDRLQENFFDLFSLPASENGQMLKRTAMISTVKGESMNDSEATTSSYWWSNIRQTVQFAEAIGVLLQKGDARFVEIGAHSALTPVIRQIIDAAGRSSKATAIATLRRPRKIDKPSNDEKAAILRCIANLHVLGNKLNLSKLFLNKWKRLVHVSLPHYPWEREECWACGEVLQKIYNSPLEGAHPLLGKRQLSLTEITGVKVKDENVVWACEFSAATLPWLQDHIIEGSIVYPAAAYVETGLQAGKELFKGNSSYILKEVKFQRFMITPDSSATVRVVAEKVGRKEYELTVYSRRLIDQSKNREVIERSSHEVALSSEWQVHAKMTIVKGERNKTLVLDVEELRKQCTETISEESLYFAIKGGSIAEGFTIGPSFRACKTMNMSQDGTAVLMLVKASNEISRDLVRYTVHPAFLDGCLQSYLFSLALRDEKASREGRTATKRVVRVPTSVQTVEVFSEVPTDLWIHLKEYQNPDGQWLGDVTAFRTDSNEVVMQFKGLVFSAITALNAKPHFWALQWAEDCKDGSEENTDKQEENKDAEVAKQKRVVLLVSMNTCKGNLLQALLQDVARSGHLIEEIVFKAGRGIDQRQTLGSHITDILIPFFDCCWDDLFESATRQEFLDMAVSPATLVLKLVAVFSDSLLKENLRIWFLTTDAYCVLPSDRINACQATAAGCLLTFAHELPQITCSLIDFPSTISEKDIGEVFLLHFGSERLKENEYAIRNIHSGGVFARFSPRLVEIERGAIFSRDCSADWALSYSSKTQTLKTSCCRRKLPSPDSVTVRTNWFSVTDDLTVNADGFIAWIAGTVDKTKVTNGFEEGDQVIGLSTEVANVIEIAHQLVVKTTETIRKPFVALKLVREFFIPFATLTEVHTLAKSDTVIIWSGTTISEAETVYKVVRSLGATATVVNEEESIFEAQEMPIFRLKSLNERFPNEQYADVIVLLDDIDGNEAKSLFRFLRPFGSCIYSANICTQLFISSEIVHNNPIKFFPMLNNKCLADTRNSNLFRRALTAFLQHINRPGSETLTTSASQTSSEFDSLMTPKDLSRRVVSADSLTADLKLTLPDESLFFAHSNERYLVTGGLRGFGLSLAEWLVQRGVRHLHLVGRSFPGEEERGQLEKLEQRAEITIHYTDVSNENAVGNLFSEICQKAVSTSTRLVGIFHCAAVYKDEILISLSQESIEKVLLPKAYGAWLLHQQTVKRKMKIDYFVLFSSTASLFGNSGQCSYCIANIILDSLASCRKGQGLPATAIQFGAVEGTGYLQQNVKVMKNLQSNGLQPLGDKLFLECMGAAMLFVSLHSLCVQGEIDAVQYIRQFPDTLNFSRLKNLKEISTELGMARSSGKTAFASAAEEEKTSIAKEILSQWLCGKVGIREVSQDVSLVSIGFDSLMAAEIGSKIQTSFNVIVPTVLLLSDQCTLGSLVDKIVSLSEEKEKQPGIPAPSKLLFSLNELGNEAVCHLICFPPNAGGVSSFANWSLELANYKIALSVVQFPGWEGRFEEPCLENLESLVQTALQVVLPLAHTQEIAFYGHSLGGLVAYELALRLRSNHEVSIRHLFVGGWYAPHLSYPHPEDFELPSAIFTGKMSFNESFELSKKLTFAGTQFPQGEVFEDPQQKIRTMLLMKKIFPCFKIGLKIVKEYLPNESLVHCGIDAFYGSSDRFVEQNHVESWRKQSNKFTLHRVDGSHLFTNQNYGFMCTVIAKAVTAGKSESSFLD